MRGFGLTVFVAARAKAGEGVSALLPGIGARLVRLIPLTLLWRALCASGADAGMTLSQLTAYTYVSVLLSDPLDVRTEASSWCYEGELAALYPCPMGVYWHLAARTVGAWLPMLLFFSLPMALLAPLFGASLGGASVFFLPSVLLTVSLGFAVDYLFSCLTVRLGGMAWLASSMRTAIAAVLSGSVIPIRLLPWGLDRIMIYQPFASLAGAPLSMLSGAGDPLLTLCIQIAWNLILWPAALFCLRASRERMVSFGG